MGSMVKAQAAASPAPTVKKVTLYVGYENYSIKIKDLRKGSKVTYTSSNKKIATVKSVLTYKDKSVSKNKTYYYKIRAVGDGTGGNTYSSYSGVRKIKTKK